MNFSNYSLKFILMNPVYCTADSDAYDYLLANEYSVYTDKEAFTGEHGLIGYNKTNEHHRNGKSRFNEKSNWIIAVGEHIPVIESSLWIQVQERLKSQSKYAFRRARTNHALLSGLVYCSCGSPIRPKCDTTLWLNWGKCRFLQSVRSPSVPPHPKRCKLFQVGQASWLYEKFLPQKF